MTNHDIAQQFTNLTAVLQVIDAKKYFFQIRSYQRVIEILENLPEEISQVYNKQKDLEFMDGIGPAIEAKIVELLETGRSQEIEQSTKLMPAGMFPLLTIPGVGAKRAHKLATTFRLNDPTTAVEQLETLAKGGAIRTLEGFGEKSEQELIENIARLRHSKGSLPYQTASAIAEKLVSYLQQSPAVSTVTPLGSLRRKKQEVGDIDIGVATEQFEEVKEHIKQYPQLLRVLADGNNLIRILLTDQTQVDIKSSPPARWGAFIQHFTGSKDHNIKLREHALRQGKSLSEHGMKVGDDSDIVAFSTEREFYRELGLDWIEPERRTGGDEIEQAKIPRKR